jgi:hypothetical protein
MTKKFDERHETYFCVLYENLYPEIAGSSKLILEDGSIINEYDNSESYTFFDYYDDFYKDTVLDNENTPHLLYTGVGSIKQFETIVYDSSTINYLNDKGLNIYLYETVLVDLPPKKKFYLNDWKDEYGADYLQFRFESTKDFYVIEMESIEEFVVRNKLTNVTVYTCEGGTSKVQHLYSFKIKSKEIFLISLLRESDTTINGYQISNKLIDEFTPDRITHKFWLGCWRYDVHRHLLCAYLTDKSAKMSWYYNSTFDDVKKFFWFDIHSWQQKFPEYYDKLIKGDKLLTTNAPWILDIDIPAAPVDLNNMWTIPTKEFYCPAGAPTPYESYFDSFCAIVTESNFANPFALFSEKTVNAMKAGRPFIIASGTGTLEYLRQHGFKTFSDFWDESYDLETNHELRIQKILAVIDYIDSMRVEELKELYSKIKPTVEHNFRRLMDLKDKNLSF